MAERSETALAPTSTPREAFPRDLVKEIAMEIGKEVASHIETMYPAAVTATSKNMLLSVRNSIHNEIMSAVDALASGDAEAWLAMRRASRRAIRAQWRKTSVINGEASYE